ncbi:CRTAC1 family protein [Dactylosporangium sp. CA-139066]|uniref:CRTAC1 family protein n=1 Tax=Dactylosporangium sp. CA-139066 TaxID=3239930 RepID=UPI003D94ED8B
MAVLRGWARRQAAGIVALLLIAAVYLIVRPPDADAAERAEIAAGYRFTPESIALPGGYEQHTIRQVNQKYERIRAWISSVGAGIAMNDLDGDGLDNDLCTTDVRIDRVVVSPTPGARSGRYQPFALDTGTLPMNDHIAPMGCLPGDFNEDGHTDLLVYWWGRTPVLFLRDPAVTTLSAAAFRPTELVANTPGPGGRYTGPQWNTNAASVADFDGDGHDDLYIGNYFPDGPVLDPGQDGGVTMNESLSAAYNGGDDHILRATGGGHYTEAKGVLGRDVSDGWTLASAAADLDGDQLPELYIANDFGPDRLLHNRSTPGHIDFAVVQGEGSRWNVPKSKRIGYDSFKGMGVDFGDLNHDGIYDMLVSNITTSFGIQESNFAFMSTARDEADVHRSLDAGTAPWRDDSSGLNLAWSGWSWDAKLADFNNRGQLQVVQTAGFVKGTVNRWAQLQELATANDELTSNTLWWPKVQEGDDLAGGQHLHFDARGADGRFQDVSQELGMAVPVPTRGIAVGDADGDGRLDLAVARQWDQPVFYHNDSPDPGDYLDLRLDRETTGSPAIGAEVRVTTADGRHLIGQVDGGSGHSGKRAFGVHIGLGAAAGPVDAHIVWRDGTGTVRQQDLRLSPGRHTLTLGAQAQETTFEEGTA